MVTVLLLMYAGWEWTVAHTSTVARATARAALAAPAVAALVGQTRYAILVANSFRGSGNETCSVHDYWVWGERGATLVAVRAHATNFSQQEPVTTVFLSSADTPSTRSCWR